MSQYADVRKKLEEQRRQRKAASKEVRERLEQIKARIAARKAKEQE